MDTIFKGRKEEVYVERLVFLSTNKVPFNEVKY